MFEKLLLAVTITFCLNLFLGVRLPNTTPTASSHHLAQTPTTLVKLLSQGLRQNLLPLYHSSAKRKV